MAAVLASSCAVASPQNEELELELGAKYQAADLVDLDGPLNIPIYTPPPPQATVLNIADAQITSGPLFIDGTYEPLVVDAGVTQQPPITIVSGANPYSDVGEMVCTRTRTSDRCGTERADYVGAYQLDTTCDSGFYDMIYGGTCWTCPADTDGRGTPWIRTATAVNTDDACHRQGLAPATLHNYRAWNESCPAGTFFDPGYSSFGSCWSCPADRPLRTAAPAHESNACSTSSLETSKARLLAFNGCPKPNAATMGLTGKRTPSNPFLDIAAGWNQSSASSGCFSCPSTDEAGNILITERNGNPIYDAKNNNGCAVVFKWKPVSIVEPGLSGLAVADLLVEDGLLADSERLSAELYLQAAAHGKPLGSLEARDWVKAEYAKLQAGPLAHESMRAIALGIVIKAALVEPSKRTRAQQSTVRAFEAYVRKVRMHTARTAQGMYAAWDAQVKKDESVTRQTTLAVAFDFGAVPYDFHNTLYSQLVLGGLGLGTAGSYASAMAVMNAVKFDSAGRALEKTSMFGLARGDALRPLNLLKGTATANGVLAGTAVITAAFAIIQSIAIDQFIKVVSAKPKLDSAYALASEPVDLGSLLRSEGGSDQVLYLWSKLIAGPANADARLNRQLQEGLAGATQSRFALESDPKLRALTLLDTTYYLNRYPDLKAAFGDDAAKAERHWITAGIDEGRDASNDFSIGAYVVQNPDVAKAYGSDYRKVVDHWFTWGRSERRRSGTVGTYYATNVVMALDPIYYARKYPDLFKAYGYKVPELTAHWVNYGISEGRSPNALTPERD